MEAANYLRVLLVEEEKFEAEELEQLLQGTTGVSFEVTRVTKIKDMTRVLEFQQFNVILLGFSFLETMGRKTIEKIRDTAPAVPIIALVHLEDNFVASMVEEYGMDDYIIKSYINKQTLVHTIHSVIQHRRMVFSLTRLLNQHAALYDDLTGLPNRALLLDRINQAVMVSKRGGEKFAALLIDVDDTQILNQDLGTENVDKILKTIGKRLNYSVHSPDTVARFTGDKFIVLLTNITNPTQPAKVAQIIQRVLSEPVDIDMQPQFISVSIGIAVYPEDGIDTKHLLTNMEEALSEAKGRGIGKIAFYNGDIQLKADSQLALEKDLRMAWAKGEFSIYYQPQIRVGNGETSSVEALIRWCHPEKGIIDDNAFYRLADETGLLVPLGDWLLRNICKQLRDWQELGLKTKMAFTISSQQFYNDQFWEKLHRTLNDNGVHPDQVILQFYEETLMQDTDGAVNILTRLKNLGMCLAVNDFGSEHCVMGFIKHLPIDILKINIDILKRVSQDSNEWGYIKAAIALANSLGKEVMACGVDNDILKQFILEQSCQYCQGNVFNAAVANDTEVDFITQIWDIHMPISSSANGYDSSSSQKSL